MAKRKCLSCGGDISAGQRKNEVTSRRGTKYVHADYKDCQAHLAKPSGRAAALRGARVRARRGVAPKRGGGGWQEKK